ncbi:MAG TPA: glycosyltransferase family 4 protein, partial [Candidatus Limnocylindria bacterium]|nr:glycosyltransferase family 4 protein [Candidatus Limnocylindria bacterium]
PDARFVAIGQSAWNAVLDRARDERWLDRGVVSEAEKAEAFARATIFAMPSEHETFGHTYLEAWCAGLPVIAGDIAPLREVVREGIDGLHARNEPRAIADAVLTLLRDPDLARRMGAAGRERARHEFSWPAVARRTEAVYRAALATRDGLRARM